jgi:2-iminobutanoate/2-iminopropanoate deaminase
VTGPNVTGDAGERHFVTGKREEQRSYSRAVIASGPTAYLAGVVDVDAQGRFITGTAEESARAVFDRLRDAVEAAGGTLADIVTMTVFLTDDRYGDDVARVRHEYFEPGHFPASALVTCVSLARPELRMEIQATAVLRG